jgi:hypothetical protein
MTTDPTNPASQFLETKHPARHRRVIFNANLVRRRLKHHRDIDSLAFHEAWFDRNRRRNHKCWSNEWTVAESWNYLVDTCQPIVHNLDPGNRAIHLQL